MTQRFEYPKEFDHDTIMSLRDWESLGLDPKCWNPFSTHENIIGCLLTIEESSSGRNIRNLWRLARWYYVKIGWIVSKPFRLQTHGTIIGTFRKKEKAQKAVTFLILHGAILSSYPHPDYYRAVIHA